MTNNDILRRIRYTFDFNDSKMIRLFGLAGYPVTREQISGWLKRDDDSTFQACSDRLLAIFLNGLIIAKRGKKEGPQPEPEDHLTHNIIFRKLKIALDLQADDILGLMKSVNFEISKHELSAFFRKPGHKHYRECKEQILRKFLKGVQLKYRASDTAKPAKNQKAGEVRETKSHKPKPKIKARSALSLPTKIR